MQVAGIQETQSRKENVFQQVGVRMAWPQKHNGNSDTLSNTGCELPYVSSVTDIWWEAARKEGDRVKRRLTRWIQLVDCWMNEREDKDAGHILHPCPLFHSIKKGKTTSAEDNHTLSLWGEMVSTAWWEWHCDIVNPIHETLTWSQKRRGCNSWQLLSVLNTQRLNCDKNQIVFSGHVLFDLLWLDRMNLTPTHS